MNPFKDEDDENEDEDNDEDKDQNEKEGEDDDENNDEDNDEDEDEMGIDRKGKQGISMEETQREGREALNTTSETREP